ncbi:titin homolog isoform X2 [Sesamum indicum]|nr:titin homolog isoform X2 [Sesamum indicum]
MATKSDFAEKLLRDLRLRKERMAATENSSQVMFGENRSPVGSSRSLNTEGSSNQIILQERGNLSSQVRDLSMAIAFALDNTAKISTPSSNPLLNFFNRLDCRKMDISNSGKHSPPTIPSVSHIDNLTEISKAVLRACSRGLNININSIEVGQELLKGAVDLEESLRMLVNLEEASECMNGARRRSRLTLLNGDDAGRDDTHKRMNQMQLDRPRFSFDKPSKNSHLVAQKNKMTKEQESTASCDLDFDGPQVRNSSSSTQEKGRISNVIAKLMGLEELPQKESMKKDLSSRENERKVSSKTRKFAEFASERSNGLLLNMDHKSIRRQNSTPVRDLTSDIKAEKRQEIDDSFKMVMVKRNIAGATDTVSAPKTATSTMKKLQKDSISQNKVTGFQICPGGEKSPPFVEDRERKMAETRLNNEPQQKAQQIEYNVSANCLEKRNGNKDLKQTAKGKRTAQVEVLKKREHSEDKNRAGPKGQQIQKESLMTKKPRGRYMESMVSAKFNLGSADNLVKKQNKDKTTYENGTLMKPIEKVGVTDPPNLDASKGNFRKEDQNQIPSLREPQNENEKATDSNLLPTPDKCIDVLAKKKEAAYKEIQKSENLRKMDVPMTRRSRTVNDLKISSKQSATMLQELKQQMHKKKNSTKGRELESDNQENRGEVGIIVTDASEEVRELTKQPEKVQNDAEPTTLLNNSVGDECQTENIQDILVPNDKCCDRDSNSAKVSSDLQKVVEPYASKNEKHLKQYDQHNEGRKASMASHKLSKPDVHKQLPESGRQEQLMEPEKELKNIVIKDQHLTEPEKELKVIVVENHYLTRPEKEPKEIALRNKHLTEPEKQPKEIVIGNQHLTEPERELKEIVIKNHYLTEPEKEPKEIVTKNQQLTEPEKELKEIVLKNHLFLNTAEALFKLNIPVSFLHAGDQNQEVGDKKLILDCGYEIMKRKARKNELTLHPYNITTLSCSKLRSLDDLVKKLCKDFEMLKLYGGSWDDEVDIASYLYKMIEKDIHGKDPDLNCMWDLEWNDMMSMFCEKEDVVRDVEKHVLNVLLDEMTNELLHVNFLV